MTEMEIDPRALKAQARARMAQAVPRAWRVTLVYLLLTTVLFTLVDAAGAGGSLPAALGDMDFVALFLSLLTALYSVVMDFGYRWWALRTYRGQGAGYGQLIDGFSMSGRVLLLEALTLLYTLGWAIVCALPISLAATFVLVAASSPVAVLLTYAGVIAATAACALCIGYRYVLAPYLLMDHPDGGVAAALRRSVEQMRGWKWQYFRLELSFLGWNLLLLLLQWAVTGLILAPRLSALFSSLWTGALADVQSFYFQLDALLQSSVLATVAAALVQIPLLLWLRPYLSLAQAGFYHARMSILPPPPPVYSPM